MDTNKDSQPPKFTSHRMSRKEFIAGNIIYFAILATFIAIPIINSTAK